MCESPLHGIQGSETLSASSARRRGMMLFVRRVNNIFLLALLNAQARLRCGDLANVDISQVVRRHPAHLPANRHVNWQVSPSESRLTQGPASQTLFA